MDKRVRVTELAHPLRSRHIRSESEVLLPVEFALAGTFGENVEGLSRCHRKIRGSTIESNDRAGFLTSPHERT